jgi:hypothetical protein
MLSEPERGKNPSYNSVGSAWTQLPACHPAIPSNSNEEFIGSFSLEMSEQEKGKRIPQNKKEKGKGMRQ